MAQVRMTRAKFDRINACANEQGVIAAAAMDQRGSLQKSIAKARGGEATGADLAAFKHAVTRVLTPHATAILLDPEYGLDAIGQRAPGRGVLLSYEETGYDVNVKGRHHPRAPLLDRPSDAACRRPVASMGTVAQPFQRSYHD